MSATPTMTISRADGEQLAQDYLNSLASCFLANDFTANESFHADTMTWNWSGDVKGEGSKADYYAVLAASWQMVCSQFVHSNAYTVVDTARGIIIICFDVVLIMDGRGAVPIAPANTFQGKNMFELTVNGAHARIGTMAPVEQSIDT